MYHTNLGWCPPAQFNPYGWDPRHMQGAGVNASTNTVGMANANSNNNYLAMQQQQQQQLQFQYQQQQQQQQVYMEQRQKEFQRAQRVGWAENRPGRTPCRIDWWSEVEQRISWVDSPRDLDLDSMDTAAPPAEGPYPAAIPPNVTAPSAPTPAPIPPHVAPQRTSPFSAKPPATTNPRNPRNGVTSPAIGPSVLSTTSRPGNNLLHQNRLLQDYSQSVHKGSAAAAAGELKENSAGVEARGAADTPPSPARQPSHNDESTDSSVTQVLGHSLVRTAGRHTHEQGSFHMADNGSSSSSSSDADDDANGAGRNAEDQQGSDNENEHSVTDDDDDGPAPRPFGQNGTRGYFQSFGGPTGATNLVASQAGFESSVMPKDRQQQQPRRTSTQSPAQSPAQAGITPGNSKGSSDALRKPKAKPRRSSATDDKDFSVLMHAAQYAGGGANLRPSVLSLAGPNPNGRTTSASPPAITSTKRTSVTRTTTRPARHSDDDNESTHSGSSSDGSSGSSSSSSSFSVSTSSSDDGDGREASQVPGVSTSRFTTQHSAGLPEGMEYSTFGISAANVSTSLGVSRSEQHFSMYQRNGGDAYSSFSALQVPAGRTGKRQSESGAYDMSLMQAAIETIANSDSGQDTKGKSNHQLPGPSPTGPRGSNVNSSVTSPAAGAGAARWGGVGSPREYSFGYSIMQSSDRSTPMGFSNKATPMNVTAAAKDDKTRPTRSSGGTTGTLPPPSALKEALGPTSATTPSTHPNPNPNNSSTPSAKEKEKPKKVLPVLSTTVANSAYRLKHPEEKGLSAPPPPAAGTPSKGKKATPTDERAKTSGKKDKASRVGSASAEKSKPRPVSPSTLKAPPVAGVGKAPLPAPVTTTTTTTAATGTGTTLPAVKTATAAPPASAPRPASAKDAKPAPAATNPKTSTHPHHSSTTPGKPLAANVAPSAPQDKVRPPVLEHLTALEEVAQKSTAKPTGVEGDATTSTTPKGQSAKDTADRAAARTDAPDDQTNRRVSKRPIGLAANDKNAPATNGNALKPATASAAASAGKSAAPSAASKPSPGTLGAPVTRVPATTGSGGGGASLLAPGKPTTTAKPTTGPVPPLTHTAKKAAPGPAKPSPTTSSDAPNGKGNSNAKGSTTAKKKESVSNGGGGNKSGDRKLSMSGWAGNESLFFSDAVDDLPFGLPGADQPSNAALPAGGRGGSAWEVEGAFDMDYLMEPSPIVSTTPATDEKTKVGTGNGNGNGSHHHPNPPTTSGGDAGRRYSSGTGLAAIRDRRASQHPSPSSYNIGSRGESPFPALSQIGDRMFSGSAYTPDTFASHGDAHGKLNVHGGGGILSPSPSDLNPFDDLGRAGSGGGLTSNKAQSGTGGGANTTSASTNTSTSGTRGAATGSHAAGRGGSCSPSGMAQHDAVAGGQSPVPAAIHFGGDDIDFMDLMYF